MKFTWLDKYTRVIAMLPPAEAGALAVALAMYGTNGEEPQDLPFQAQLAFEALREDVEYSRSMTEKGIKSGESRRSHKSSKPISERKTMTRERVQDDNSENTSALSAVRGTDSTVTVERANEDTMNDTPLESRTDKEHEVAPVQEESANGNEHVQEESANAFTQIQRTQTNAFTQTQRTRSRKNAEPKQCIALHSKALDKEKNILKKEKFKKPNVDEVRTYVSEEHLSVDPERFCAYYDSVGWRVGKNPMKSWKAACRTWNINAQKSVQSAGEEPYANDLERKVGHDVYEQLAIYN